MRKATVMFVGVLVVLTMALSGCGGGGGTPQSRHEGFFNTAKLEQSLASQVNDALHSTEAVYGIDGESLAGKSVDRINCILETGRMFDCRIALSSGYLESAKVLVSEDGDGWVPSDGDNTLR